MRATIGVQVRRLGEVDADDVQATPLSPLQERRAITLPEGQP
jgi:hypothetical protein